MERRKGSKMPGLAMCSEPMVGVRCLDETGGKTRCNTKDDSALIVPPTKQCFDKVLHMEMRYSMDPGKGKLGRHGVGSRRPESLEKDGKWSLLAFVERRGIFPPMDFLLFFVCV